MSSVKVSVPLIDISDYLDGDAAAKEGVVQRVRDACETQGFLQVVGHRVTPDIQRRFIDVISAFFALPLAEKEKVSMTKSPCSRGYETLGGQKLDELDPDATPDQKEGFSVRRDRPLGDFLQGPNKWPDAHLAPDFKAVYTEYFDAVHSLSKTMFRIIALSLGMPEDYFDAFAADPDGICLCRSHHYPPTPADASGRTRGVGQHTDFGALTLLLQDDGACTWNIAPSLLA